jgi:hypothetical protein
MHQIMSDSNIGNWHSSNVQTAVSSAHLTKEGGHCNVFKGVNFSNALICGYCSSLRAAVELRVEGIEGHRG